MVNEGLAGCTAPLDGRPGSMGVRGEGGGGGGGGAAQHEDHGLDPDNIEMQLLIIE